LDSTGNCSFEFEIVQCKRSTIQFTSLVLILDDLLWVLFYSVFGNLGSFMFSFLMACSACHSIFVVQLSNQIAVLLLVNYG